MTQIVVVFVPGTTGSSLVNPSALPALRTVWPDDVAADPALAAIVLSESGIQAGAPLLTVGLPGDEKPLYQPLVDNFASLGFVYAPQNAPLPSASNARVLIGYGYDWRQPNESTGNALGQYLVNTIAKTYPGAQVWLVAHSMGGLICRYVIEAVKPAITIAGLITLGTPHLGAPLALSAVTGEANISSLLSAKVVEQVVDLPAYPSAFQLLPPWPPSGQAFVFDSSGNPYSIYSGDVFTLLTTQPPNGFGAPASSFTAATNFFSKLDYGSSQNGRPEYYVAYGSGLATVTSFLYDVGVALTPELQLMQSASFGGDSIVPQWSASFSGGWAPRTYAAAGVSHGGLVSDAATFGQIAAWMQLNSSSVVADVAPLRRPVA